MLRVRPTMITTDTERMAALFRTLGLLPAEGTPGETLYDAGGGRIALRRAGDGPDRIGFEAGDLAEFARRTRESGTAAELAGPGGGTPAATATAHDATGPLTAVRVTAPGIAFTVHQGERADRSGVDPDLTVVCVWHTPEPTAAAKVLGDIGARPLPPNPDGRLDFAAKNGGLVSVRAGEHQRVDVGFEYTGELPGLRDRMLAAGFPAVLGGPETLLRVSLPSGGKIRITAPRNPRM